MNEGKVTITLIIALVLAVGIAVYLGVSKPEPEIIHKTEIQRDTVYIDVIKTVENLKPVFKYIHNSDTVFYGDTTVIFQPVYFDTSGGVTGKYIAEIDTGDGDYNLSLRFISDKILSTNSYFDYDLRIRQKTITETVTVFKESPRPWIEVKPVLFFGGAYGVIEKKFDIGLGLGVGIFINP